MCVTLDVPRSPYYQSRNQTISNREKENIELTDKIVEMHNASNQRYGAQEIHYLLRQSGFTVGIKRVQCLMKKAGIRSIVVMKFRPIPSKEKVILNVITY